MDTFFVNTDRLLKLRPMEPLALELGEMIDHQRKRIAERVEELQREIIGRTLTLDDGSKLTLRDVPASVWPSKVAQW